ncbi:hypothetical protein NE237_002817 [Protea cynaroides]|uniref:Uncharacterized protein n=1 Tax=Protea cynaroides TaxID=273540 RepID=A0A9Q0QS05_9MAGN|nr:hypothetical protein NE237_002817 [Protea cynaroides]
MELLDAMNMSYCNRYLKRRNQICRLPAPARIDTLDFDSLSLSCPCFSFLMKGIRGMLFKPWISVPTWSMNRPSETLKRKVAEMEKLRKKKRDLKKDEFFVETPESKAFLDTMTMPMVLTAVACALFAKILMMYDESKSQERIERKIQKAPPGQGTVRMLSREEWEEIQEVRPRTPFESKLARPNARIRTGEPLHMDDVKDWTIDVLTDALTRVEETVGGAK